MTSPGIAVLALSLLHEPPPSEVGPPTAREEAPWRFDAFVYYWSASLTGDLTVDGQEVDLDGEGDGFSGDPALSGFLGSFEASRGAWSVVLAPIFVNVEATGDESGSVDAKVEIRAQIHEGFVAHDLVEDWQWLAGARYYGLSTDVDLSQGGVPVGSADSTRSWVDPIVGVRYRGDLGRDWWLRGRADVGGFGLGSDLAWNASALFGYQFSAAFGAQLGYRALHIDFEEGSGSDRAAYDLSMYGPVVGVSFSF